MTRSQVFGLVGGLTSFFVLAFAPMPDGLAGPGQGALAVMSLCLWWWLFTPVAMPVTSLMGLALLPLLGVMDKNQAMALFGSQAVFFVIAAFMVAAVSIRTGLSTRVALWALKRTSRNEDVVCLTVLLVAAGLTGIVISHAVAALLLPIMIEVLRALDVGPGSRFARRLLLSMAWGTICGSNLSLLSSARASLATGMYATYAERNELASVAIDFFEFSSATIWPSVASLALAFVVLRLFHRPEGIDMAPAIRRLEERASALGKISTEEWLTGTVIVGMVLALVVFGKQYGLGTIALLSAGVLYLTQVTRWEDTEASINWGVALLYGGAIAVAQALEETHAVGFLVENYLPVGALNPWVLLALCAVLTVVVTAFVSNAAAIALLLPICLTVAGQVGLNPKAMAILLPVAAGLDFSLPVSTPAMAMVFGTGYLRTQDSVIPGVCLSILALTATMFIAAYIWPLIGLSAM